MRLEELVDQHYDRLSANDRELLASIFREKVSISTMNSTQAAEFLHISRTALVRLLKKLGLDTYAQFKLLLTQKGTMAEAVRFDMLEIASNYRLLIDELKKHDYTAICRMLNEAETIYLYGSGNEQKAIAEEFKRIFLILGKCCVSLFDYGEVEFARQRFLPRDLFIAISLSGEGAETLRVVRYAQAGNIRTLSITRWENNALARMCQESLYVGTRTIQQAMGQSYELVAAFYILLHKNRTLCSALTLVNLPKLNALKSEADWEEKCGEKAGWSAQPSHILGGAAPKILRAKVPVPKKGPQMPQHRDSLRWW